MKDKPKKELLKDKYVVVPPESVIVIKKKEVRKGK